MTSAAILPLVLSAGAIKTSDQREEERSDGVRLRLRRDRLVRATATAALLWVAGFAIATASVGGGGLGGKILGDVVYIIPVGLAAVLCTAAARSANPAHRRFWQLLAASNALWFAGELVWGSYGFFVEREVPFPSLADAFYVGSYALVIPAILAGFRPAIVFRSWRALLDASTMMVAIGFAGWVWLISPQLESGASLATATGIAYPLLGVAILMALGTVGFGAHRRLPTSVVVVAAAFAVSALTDSGYTYLTVLHEYAPGSWLNVGWQLEAALLCLAAVIALRHDEGEAQRQSSRRDFGLPLVLAGAASIVVVVALDVADNRPRLGDVVLAAYVCATVLVRLYLTSREQARLAADLEHALREQERVAVTDGLTGLHNRRFFEELLRIESDRAVRQNCSLGLLVADLDHFKLVNDEYGHPAGDRVLCEAARRLAAAVRSCDIVARYGGEEFVIVLPEAEPEVVLEVAERCRGAVGDRPFTLADGRRLTLTTSIGGACQPAHVATAAELVRVADKELYRAKELGRNRVEVGPDSVSGDTTLPQVNSILGLFESVADEVELRQGADAHSREMAWMAGQVADSLGLHAASRWRAVAGARLHDIGKFALPNEILAKRGPLTSAEWERVHEHPSHGARLLGQTPEFKEVARVVLDHHERPDGLGYPNGKAGAELSIEARIVAVCDAWSAMRSDRPYRSALSPEAARDELLLGSGTQFDAVVVETLLGVVSYKRDARTRVAVPA